MSTIAIRIQTAGRVVQDLHVEPGAGRNGRALRVKVPPDSRVEMQDLVSGLGPQPLAVKRVGNALHVSFQAKAAEAPDLVLDDFFQPKDRKAPSLLGRTSDHGMQDYVPEQAAGDAAPRLAEGASSDLTMPGQPAAGSAAAGAATGGAEAGAASAGGLSWTAIGIGAGVVVVAGAAAGGGGGDGDPAPATLAAPRALSLNAQADGRVLVAGQAEAGSTVTVTFPDGTRKAATTQADGRFEVLSDAAQPSGEVAASARDAAGQTSPQATAAYQDLIAPAAPTLSFTPQADGSAVARGSAEAGTQVTVRFPDASEQTVRADASGQYTLTSAQAQTSGSGSAVATDASGNASSAATARLVDRVAPGQAPSVEGATDDQILQTGTVPSGGSTNDATPLLLGSLGALLEPGGQVLVLRDGTLLGEARVDGTRWSFQDRLGDDGRHSYTALVTDAAGNRGPASTPFELDLDLTAPRGTGRFSYGIDDTNGKNAFFESGATILDDSPTIFFSVSELGPGERVELVREGRSESVPFTLNQDGAYYGAAQDSGLVDGSTYHYQLRIVDAAGNVALTREIFTLTYDTQQAGTPPGPQALVWQDAQGEARLWAEPAAQAPSAEPRAVPDLAAGTPVWAEDPWRLAATEVGA